jgi:hypothetical protein
MVEVILGEMEYDRELSDMRVALHFSNEIVNPCTIETPDGRVISMRNTHLQSARYAIDNLSNPVAINLLENFINIYSD